MRTKALAAASLLVLVVSCGGDAEPEVTSAPSPSPEASAPEDVKKPQRKPRIADGEIEVVAIALAFRPLPKAVAGPTAITLRNSSDFGHETRVVRLEKGDDLASITEMDRGEVLDRLTQLATTGIVDRGKTSDPLKMNLKPGSYGLLCLLGFPDDTHASRGMWAELKVVKKA